MIFYFISFEVTNSNLFIYYSYSPFRNKAVVGVIEPCSHSIQIHGLCALCGADITTKDHNGIEYAQRATISMAHNVIGLTVSLNEAERLERETSIRLLEERKLSLIVDLDQTLIQATVDPSIEEWLKDENNEVVKDIRKFVLPDSPSVYYIKLRYFCNSNDLLIYITF